MQLMYRQLHLLFMTIESTLRIVSVDFSDQILYNRIGNRISGGGGMRKKIHTANEEVRNIGFLIFFSVLWYSQLFGMIAAGGFHATLLIFLLAGLLPLGGAVRMVQKLVHGKILTVAISWILMTLPLIIL